MDSNRIKKLASGVRASLIAQVSAKLDRVLAEGSAERLDMPHQVKEIESAIEELGRNKVIEANAYTWFNRLCALRFMDVHGYTPVAVVTPKQGSTQPQILADALQGIFDSSLGFDRLVRDKIEALISGVVPAPNPLEAVYELILTTVCTHYATAMPYLFKDGAGASRLLMPQGLLAENSLLRQIVEEMDAASCESVEVLGWLYQFYIAEKKDEVFASKSKRGAAEIPAATQLFTPNWIVRYMAENSLGRLWMLNNPDSSLKESMDYYIEGETPADYLKVYSPEEITVLDPACGSGHILVYAFDLLYAMYEEEGYLPEEIPERILTNNLFGFEIDQRAAEIALFALEMKARAKDPKFFERSVDANITVLDPIRFTQDELEHAGMLAERTDLLEAYAHLDEIGSLYVPEPADGIVIDNAIANIQQQSGIFAEAVVKRLEKMKELNEKLSRTFSVVVANPPYMPVSSMESWAKKWVEQYYPEVKSDLFSCFVKRNLEFTQSNGDLGFMTPFVWMFISSYEKMRKLLIDEATITSLVQLEYSGFDGATVPICTFTIQNSDHKDFKGSYIRLSDFVGAAKQAPKTLEAIQNPDCGWFYKANAQNFKKIPGSPIVFHLGKGLTQAFSQGKTLADIAQFKTGMVTGDNDRFLRLWWEVSENNYYLSAHNNQEALDSEKRWFPYNKGGKFRRWYGNNDYLIDYGNNGEAIFSTAKEDGRAVTNMREELRFKTTVSWSKISSALPAFRLKEHGFLYDKAGLSFYPQSKADALYTLGLCNSSFAIQILCAMAPTLNFELGDIWRIPVYEDLPNKNEVNSCVENCLSTTKQDWDAFETSWDFERHPLLPQEGDANARLADTYNRWETECQERFNTLKSNEEELNRIFAKIYNMEDQVPITVPADKVSVRLADKTRDIKSLISYGIGCIFGRYSVDTPGLILADQGSTTADFKAKVPNASFAIDQDGILPILDGEWFQDDIVVTFKDWLASTYSKDTLQANIAFIEEALGENLRTYFVKHFYDDHVRVYQKRPIYWLFSSPKKSFSALIYLHRYNQGTVGTILTDYLRDYIAKLNAARASLETSERAQDVKQADKYRSVVKELEDWERTVIYPLAHERKALDLDDGVKVNYNKFPHALRKITGLSEWK